MRQKVRINELYEKVEERLGGKQPGLLGITVRSGHWSIMFKLIRKANSLFWEDSFTITRKELKEGSGVKSNTTYYRILNDLQRLGLIRVSKGTGTGSLMSVYIHCPQYDNVPGNTKTQYDNVPGTVKPLSDNVPGTLSNNVPIKKQENKQELDKQEESKKRASEQVDKVEDLKSPLEGEALEQALAEADKRVEAYVDRMLEVFKIQEGKPGFEWLTDKAPQILRAALEDKYQKAEEPERLRLDGLIETADAIKLRKEVKRLKRWVETEVSSTNKRQKNKNKGLPEKMRRENLLYSNATDTAHSMTGGLKQL